MTGYPKMVAPYFFSFASFKTQQVFTAKHIVPQDQAYMAFVDELFVQEERLRQTFGPHLHLKGKGDSATAPISQKPLIGRQIL